jgi:serine protease
MSSLQHQCSASTPQKKYRLQCVALAICGVTWSAVTHAAVSADATQAARMAAKISTAPTDRLIVRYRDASAIVQLAGQPVRMAQAVDASVLNQRSTYLNQIVQGEGFKLRLLRQTGTGAHVYKLNKAMSPTDLDRIAKQLKASDSAIEFVAVDRKMFPLMSTNDPELSKQWSLGGGAGGIRATSAWDVSTGKGVVVAVLDTGIVPHVDLEGQIVPGYDMIADLTTANDGDGRDGDASDPGDSNGRPCPGFDGDIVFGSSWHGTHVGGIVAAKTNNSLGIAGIAINAKVQSVRVLGVCGGFTSDIADGIIWAAGGSVPGLPTNPTPAKVLNLSLGGVGACEKPFQEALDQAKSLGAVAVIAAGNEGEDVSDFQPANCTGVVAVAATNRRGGRADYSNFGDKITLAAPGGEFAVTDGQLDESGAILSTLNDGYVGPRKDIYAFYQGTSMAAPHVAGVAALVLGSNPTATPDQVIDILKRSARPFPADCSKCGSGLLDAQAAVKLTGPSPWTNEVEPNNRRIAANLLSAPGQLRGMLARSSDRDFFRVDLPPGKTLVGRLDTTASRFTAALTLVDSAGTTLSANPMAAHDFVYHNDSKITKAVYMKVESSLIEEKTPYRLDVSW